jgi:hypothetical protein
MFSLELFLLFLELVYGRVEIPLGIPDPCESGLWRFSGVLPWLECWNARCQVYACVRVTIAGVSSGLMRLRIRPSLALMCARTRR